MMPVVKKSVRNAKRSGLSAKKTVAKVSAQDDSFVSPDFKPPAVAGLADDLQSCSRNMTPTCYQALYNIPTPDSATAGLGVGVYEQGDYFAESDLDQTFAAFAPYIPQGTYPIPALIDGAQYSFPPNATDYVGGEANLDIYIA